MTTVIEIVRSVETEEARRVIAECNMYDAADNLVRQCSRSPFEFPIGTTDEQIIAALAANEYSQYFAVADEL